MEQLDPVGAKDAKAELWFEFLALDGATLDRLELFKDDVSIATLFRQHLVQAVAPNITDAALEPCFLLQDDSPAVGVGRRDEDVTG